MTVTHRITANGLTAVIIRRTYGNTERVTVSLETAWHTPLETRECRSIQDARRWAQKALK